MGCTQCYCSGHKVACKSSSLVYHKVAIDFKKENWYVSDLKNEWEDYVDLVNDNEIKYDTTSLAKNEPIYFVNSFQKDLNVNRVFLFYF